MTVSALSAQLSYRIASLDDLAQLTQYRVECGWGAPLMAGRMQDPNRTFCIFQLEHDGVKQDIGMGGWVLEYPDDKEAANREDGVVNIVSLFIQKQYQGGGWGVKAMDLLERTAVELYDAVWVTLDTAAYLIDRAPGTDHYAEDFDRPNSRIKWYEKRGYRQYRDPRPQYPEPLPDDPSRLLMAVYMRKDAALVRQQHGV